MPHLILDVSAHGFGHLAQVTPVVSELRALLPNLHLTLRCSAPRGIVESFLGSEIDLIPAPDAAVLAMNGPDQVDVGASLNGYRDLHSNWLQCVKDEADKLNTLQPDLLVSDVDYLGLAAAKEIGLPAIAMSSLNWADIADAYIADQPQGAEIIAQMRDAYDYADPFLRFEPALPMSGFSNSRAIGPVARLGINRRTAINDQLGLDDDGRLGLVSFGGIAAADPSLSLSRVPNMHWIVGGDMILSREDVTPVNRIDISFIDLLTSVDLVVTKPGYGMFAEATCNGTAILYTKRTDWPEYPVFVDWLDRHARSRGLGLNGLASPGLSEDIDALLSKAQPERPEPTGGRQAAEAILQALSI